MSVREVSRMEASPIPTGRSAKQRAGLAFRASPALCFAVYAPGSILLAIGGMDVRSVDVAIVIAIVVIAVIAIVIVAMNIVAAAM
jgi:hypothetical protein